MAMKWWGKKPILVQEKISVKNKQKTRTLTIFDKCECF